VWSGDFTVRKTKSQQLWSGELTVNDCGGDAQQYLWMMFMRLIRNDLEDERLWADGEVDSM
jgi:hypothetical protein